MDKETMKLCGSLLFMVVMICVFIFYIKPNMESMLGLSDTSPCNKYTNATSSGIRYISGLCYIPTYSYYETREVCRGGILGIGQSCYESDEKHTERIRGTKCIIADTGERC